MGIIGDFPGLDCSIGTAVTKTKCLGIQALITKGLAHFERGEVGDLDRCLQEITERFPKSKIVFNFDFPNNLRYLHVKSVKEMRLGIIASIERVAPHMNYQFIMPENYVYVIEDDKKKRREKKNKKKKSA